MSNSRIGNLLVGLGFDTTGLTTGASKAKRELSGYNRYAKKQSAGISGHFVKMFGVIGGAFAIGSIISDAGRVVMEFEQSIADLASITGKSVSDMDNLVKSARQIGSVSSFSASEVVKLQTELAKLGFSEEEIIDSAKAVGDFSVALGTDAASAATFAGSALRSFGIDAADTESVLDTLALATTKSALDFEKLQTGLTVAAPVAKAAGIGINQLTAQLGILSDRGLDASTAGTSLRNIFLDLADKGLTLDEALTQINGSQNKLTKANELFGKRGATTALILAENSDAVDTLEASITNANGALQAMTDTRLATATGSLKLFRSAWEELAISVGNTGAVISSIDFGTSLLTASSTAINEGFGTAATDFFQGYNDRSAKRAEVDAFNTRQQYEDVNSALAVQADIFGILNVAAAPVTEGVKTYKEEIAELSNELSKYQDLLTNQAPGSEEYSNTLDRISSIKSKLAQRQKEYNGVLTTTSSITDTATTANLTLSEEISELEKSIADLVETYVTTGSVNDKLLEQAAKETAAVKTLNEQYERQQAIIQSLSEDRKTLIAPTSIGSIALPDNVTSLSGSLEPLAAYQNDTSLAPVQRGGGTIFTGVDSTSTSSAAGGGIGSFLEDNATDIGSGFTDNLINGWSQARSELAALREELEGYQAVLRDPSATEAQIASAKASIEATEAQIESKQREASAAVLVAQAIIGSTGDIVNAYLRQALAAQIASNSSAGLPGLIAASIGVGIITSLFQAATSATAFEKGGIIDLPGGPASMSTGGLLQGPSHSQGGIAALVGGRTPVELEGGEVIINKRSSSLFSKELSEINSYNGYGKSFAIGGPVSYSSTTSNTSTTALDNMRKVFVVERPTAPRQQEQEVMVRVDGQLSGESLRIVQERAARTARRKGNV